MNEDFLKELFNRLGGESVGGYDEFMQALEHSEDFRQHAWKEVGGESIGSYSEFMEATGIGVPSNDVSSVEPPERPKIKSTHTEKPIIAVHPDVALPKKEQGQPKPQEEKVVPYDFRNDPDGTEWRGAKERDKKRKADLAEWDALPGVVITPDTRKNAHLKSAAEQLPVRQFIDNFYPKGLGSKPSSFEELPEQYKQEYQKQLEAKAANEMKQLDLWENLSLLVGEKGSKEIKEATSQGLTPLGAGDGPAAESTYKGLLPKDFISRSKEERGELIDKLYEPLERYPDTGLGLEVVKGLLKTDFGSRNLPTLLNIPTIVKGIYVQTALGLEVSMKGSKDLLENLTLAGQFAMETGNIQDAMTYMGSLTPLQKTAIADKVYQQQWDKYRSEELAKIGDTTSVELDFVPKFDLLNRVGRRSPIDFELADPERRKEILKNPQLNNAYNRQLENISSIINYNIDNVESQLMDQAGLTLNDISNRETGQSIVSDVVTYSLEGLQGFIPTLVLGITTRGLGFIPAVIGMDYQSQVEHVKHVTNRDVEDIVKSGAINSLDAIVTGTTAGALERYGFNKISSYFTRVSIGSKYRDIVTKHGTEIGRQGVINWAEAGLHEYNKERADIATGGVDEDRLTSILESLEWMLTDDGINAGVQAMAGTILMGGPKLASRIGTSEADLAKQRVDLHDKTEQARALHLKTNQSSFVTVFMREKDEVPKYLEGVPEAGRRKQADGKVAVVYKKSDLKAAGLSERFNLDRTDAEINEMYDAALEEQIGYKPTQEDIDADRVLAGEAQVADTYSFLKKAELTQLESELGELMKNPERNAGEIEILQHEITAFKQGVEISIDGKGRVMYGDKEVGKLSPDAMAIYDLNAKAVNTIRENTKEAEAQVAEETTDQQIARLEAELETINDDNNPRIAEIDAELKALEQTETKPNADTKELEQIEADRKEELGARNFLGYTINFKGKEIKLKQLDSHRLTPEKDYYYYDADGVRALKVLKTEADRIAKEQINAKYDALRDTELAKQKAAKPNADTKADDTKQEQSRHQEPDKSEPPRVDTTVSEMAGRPVVVESHPGEKIGIVTLEEGSFYINMPDGTSYLLGTEAGVSEVALSDANDTLTLREEDPVTFSDSGNPVYRGSEYVNNYTDPQAAINRDENGGIISVNLETPSGEKRTFRGQSAQDIAYAITIKQISENNETAGKFEEFIKEQRESEVVVEPDAVTAKPITEQVPTAESASQQQPSPTVTTTLPGGKSERTYIKEGDKWYVAKKDGTASKVEVKKPEFVTHLETPLQVDSTAEQSDVSQQQSQEEADTATTEPQLTGTPKYTTAEVEADLPDGRIKGTGYEVKEGAAYHEGVKIANPNKLPLSALIKKHIKERAQLVENSPPVNFEAGDVEVIIGAASDGYYPTSVSPIKLSKGALKEFSWLDNSAVYTNNSLYDVSPDRKTFILGMNGVFSDMHGRGGSNFNIILRFPEPIPQSSEKAVRQYLLAAFDSIVNDNVVELFEREAGANFTKFNKRHYDPKVKEDIYDKGILPGLINLVETLRQPKVTDPRAEIEVVENILKSNTNKKLLDKAPQVSENTIAPDMPSAPKSTVDSQASSEKETTKFNSGRSRVVDRGGVLIAQEKKGKEWVDMADQKSKLAITLKQQVEGGAKDSATIEQSVEAAEARVKDALKDFMTAFRDTSVGIRGEEQLYRQFMANKNLVAAVSNYIVQKVKQGVYELKDFRAFAKENIPGLEKEFVAKVYNQIRTSADPAWRTSHLNQVIGQIKQTLNDSLKAKDKNAQQAQFIRAVKTYLEDLHGILSDAQIGRLLGEAVKVNLNKPKTAQDFTIALAKEVSKANARKVKSIGANLAKITSEKSILEKKKLVQGKLPTAFMELTRSIHKAVMGVQEILKPEKEAERQAEIERLTAENDSIVLLPRALTNAEATTVVVNNLMIDLLSSVEGALKTESDIKNILKTGRSLQLERIRNDKKDFIENQRDEVRVAVGAKKLADGTFAKTKASDRATGKNKRANSFWHKLKLATTKGKMVLMHDSLRTLLDVIDGSVTKGFNGVLDKLIYTRVTQARSNKIKARNEILDLMKSVLSSIYAPGETNPTVANRKVRARINSHRKPQEISYDTVSSEVTTTLPNSSNEKTFRNENGEWRVVKPDGSLGGAVTNQANIDALNNAAKQPSSVLLTVEQMMNIYNILETADENTHETLKEMGESPEFFAAVYEALSEADKAYATALREVVMPAIADKMETTYERMYYTAFPRLSNYWPKSRNAGDSDSIQAEQAENQQTAFAQMGSATNRPTTAFGNLYGRVNSKIPFDFTVDATALTMQMMEKGIHFATFGEVIRDMNRLFSDPVVVNSIIDKHGSVPLNIIKETYIKTLANEANLIQDTFVNFEWLREKLVTSSLAIALKIGIGQLTSTFAMMSEIPSSQFVKHFPNSINFLFENHNFFVENSQLYKDRMEGSFDRDLAATLKKKGYDQILKSGSITDFLMIAIKLGDAGAVLLGGYPVYMHHFSQQKNAGKSDAEAQVIAIREFEKAFSTSQQSSYTENKSALELNTNGLVKLFTTFQSAALALQRGEWKAWRDLVTPGRSKADALKRLVLYHFVSPMLFTGVSNLLFNPDDEDFATTYKRLAIFGSLSAFFVYGSVLNTLADYVQKKPWALRGASGQSNILFDAIADIGTMTVDAVKGYSEAKKDAATFDEKVNWEGVIMDNLDLGMRSLDIGTGLPFTKGKKLVDNLIFANAKGDELSSSELLLLLGGWNRYAVLGTGGGGPLSNSVVQNFPLAGQRLYAKSYKQELSAEELKSFKEVFEAQKSQDAKDIREAVSLVRESPRWQSSSIDQRKEVLKELSKDKMVRAVYTRNKKASNRWVVSYSDQSAKTRWNTIEEKQDAFKKERLEKEKAKKDGQKSRK